MGRRLTRSEPDQVAPDVMLAQRFLYEVFLDAPPDRGGEPHPVMPYKGDPGAFGAMELAYESVGALTFSRPLFWVEQSGRVRPAVSSGGKRKTSVLSYTSKMAAPSFSIPAGPPKEGGACIAAAIQAGRGLRRGTEKPYICDACYAIEGQYRNTSTVLAQGARLAWVLQLLEQDPSGALLASELVRVVEDFARRDVMGGSKSSGVLERLLRELGVWQHGGIQVPVSRDPRGPGMLYMPAVTTAFPEVTGYEDANDFFARTSRPAEGDVVGFFRLHDSGDFSVSTDPKISLAYIRAWRDVALALPHVIFWAPTRVWPFPHLWRELLAAMRAAPNLVARPSSLFVDAPAPELEGGVAGTTVSSPLGDGRYMLVPQPSSGELPWVCPVYTKTVLDRETGRMVEARSCLQAGCRACWVARGLPVTYGYHCWLAALAGVRGSGFGARFARWCSPSPLRTQPSSHERCSRRHGRSRHRLGRGPSPGRAAPRVRQVPAHRGARQAPRRSPL